MGTLAALPPEKTPGTQRTGGWVGPGAGLDGCGEEKHLLSPPGFEPRIVHSVASRCTDYDPSPEVSVPAAVPLCPPLMPHKVALLKSLKICVHFRMLIQQVTILLLFL
jgi:hypothetical protein